MDSLEINIDGTTDGPWDATGFVGDAEALKVGESLGELDGPILETTVGLCVGTLDGPILETTVGLCVGTLDGSNEKVTVGALVGSSLGT